MKTKIQTENAPAAIGIYSQAIKVGNTIYISGQIPLIPETMLLVEGDFTEQAGQVFNNLAEICKASGGSLDSIVKLTIYLTDFRNFPQVNQLMEQLFTEPYPARATIQVSALPKGAEVEIDAVMVTNSTAGE